MKSVAGFNFQTRDERNANDVMRVVWEKNNHLPPGRGQRREIFMLHGQASAIRQVNPERLERLRMEGFADFPNLHTDLLILMTVLCKF